MRRILSLLIYLYIIYIALRIFRSSNQSTKVKSWIYGFAMPSSFLTGWAFLGMTDLFIRTDITFISFYFSIILFAPLLPLFFERLNRIILKHSTNDILSFITKGFRSDKTIKIVSFLIIITVGLVYVFINLKSLLILFGENKIIFPISLIIILAFIVLLKDWDIITSVAFQGIIMLISYVIIASVLTLNSFGSFSELFNQIKLMAPKKIIVNDTSSLGFWNINILTTVFAYLFLPRQFSIITQAREIPAKTKAIKIVIVSTVFFLIYIFSSIAISSFFYLKEGYFGNIIETVKEYGSLFYILFLLSGISFILSTFNQQISAFLKIFETNFNINKYLFLTGFILVTLSLFYLLGDVYINSLGTFCLSSLFTIITPVMVIIFSKDSNNYIIPARISFIFSLFFTVLMFIGLITDPQNHSKPIADFSISLIKKISINENYLFSFSLYPNIISLILFGIEKYALNKKRENREEIYKNPDLYLLDKISSFFNYNFYLISLFTFFYNNKNSSFTLLEIKDLYPLHNIESLLKILEQKNVIKKSSLGVETFKYNKSFYIKEINPSSFQYFINAFLFTRSIIYSVEDAFEKRKEIYKEKIDVMNRLYKIYITLSNIKTKKGLTEKIGKLLPQIEPGIVKIEIEHIDKKISLYQSPDFFMQKKIFPIKITKKEVMYIYLKDNHSEELLFYIEPLIRIFYKNAMYIHKIQDFIIKINTLNKIRSFFISNISHEIRTPLTPLKGYISFLKGAKDIKEEEIKEALEIMEQSYKRLEKIVNSLIDIKNIDLESTKKDKISLQRLLETSINDNINNITNKNIKLNTDFKTDKETKIEGDFRKLRIAIDAIIDNAVKFNRKDGKVFIETLEQNKFVIIKVKDTGIGIKKTDIKRIFEPFFQCDLDDNKKYEGLGLGLSIAKRIIKNQEGLIKIRSKQNKGTIVYIYLKKA